MTSTTTQGDVRTRLNTWLHGAFLAGEAAIGPAGLALLRADIEAAHAILAAISPPPVVGGEGRREQERWQDELRDWCAARALECGTKAQDGALAEGLKLGWAMSADTFACVIEKIDNMDPVKSAAPPPSSADGGPGWRKALEEIAKPLDDYEDEFRALGHPDALAWRNMAIAQSDIARTALAAAPTSKEAQP